MTPEEIEAAEIQALLPAAALFFGLGKIQQVTPTPFGIGNESFFVTTSTGEFVFRVLWEQSIAGLSNEIAIEQQLAKANVLAVQLLAGENGQHYFTDGHYTITASSRIAGVHPEVITPSLLLHVGETLARFHMAVTSLPQETNAWLDLNRAHQQTTQIRSEEIKKTIEHNLYVGAIIFDQDLPTGFIHGDLYSGNLILTPENRLAILDFETTKKNPFIVDIARTILNMCEANQVINQPYVEELLDGYQKIRQLTSAEKTYLPYALSYVSGAMAAWLIVEREQNEVAREILHRAASFKM